MTFRDPNKIIEQEGENFIRSIVQSYNSIFQVIDGRNDQGNDAYIELVVDNWATNFGFFAQIKSGLSYKYGMGYKIPTDQAHLHYWRDPLYPILGIVYDPDLQKAFWIDVKEYISKNPVVLEQKTHNIRVSPNQEFSSTTFPAIRDQLIEKMREYKSLQNFGQSLTLFASVDSPDVCYEGFKSLYANHRDRDAAWFYMLSAFAKIKEEGIRRNILGVVSNYIDNPYIFWHAGNKRYLPTPERQKQVKKLLNQTFGLQEIRLALPYLKEGVTVGSFSYLVYLVISQVEKAYLLLKELAFEPGTDPDERNLIFWLYLHTAKYYSIEQTLKTAEEYLKLFPHGYLDEALMGTIESIELGDLSPIGC